MKYKINEIFYSIQGEGFHTGTPAVFIRFSGCNMKCPFCDTEHQGHTLKTADEIIDNISMYPGRMLVFTGGEPLIQDINYLMFALRSINEDLYIAVESNGTKKRPGGINWFTNSPKAPNYKYQPDADELKYIVTPDFDPNVIALNYGGRIYLQPMSNRQDMIAKAVDIVKRRGKCRLSLQTQKLINIP